MPGMELVASAVQLCAVNYRAYMKNTYVYIKDSSGSVSLLSHKGETAFSRRVAGKHLSEWLAKQASDIGWLVNQYGEASPSADAMERKARRLYKLRLADPHAPEYYAASRLFLTAKAIRGMA